MSGTVHEIESQGDCMRRAHKTSSVKAHESEYECMVVD